MKDFLIVGCGLYGATMAERVREAGYSCMILEKREHIAGNAYTQEVDGIHVHRYGAHIFHTSDPQIWRFVGRFAEFNRFTNCPLANYHGEIYNLPFNMNTFNRLWGVTTPAQARELIARQRREVLQVARVGQLVDVHDALVRLGEPVEDEVGADETGPSGN